MYLLHSETVPRSGRERLEDTLLVARESCIETFDAWSEPAFGEEAVAVDEVVWRTVGGEMGNADANLGMIVLAWLRR